MGLKIYYTVLLLIGTIICFVTIYYTKRKQLPEGLYVIRLSMKWIGVAMLGLFLLMFFTFFIKLSTNYVVIIGSIYSMLCFIIFGRELKNV